MHENNALKPVPVLKQTVMNTPSNKETTGLMKYIIKEIDENIYKESKL
jgi:hypothetical protein